MAFEDYYSLLGLTKNSNDEEIRKSFRRLVLQLHPDKNPENPAAVEQFKRVLDAYQVISVPAKRAEYDVRFTAFEEAIAINQANEKSGDSSERSILKPKKTAKRTGKIATGIVDFRVYASEFKESDVLRGTVTAAVVASLWSAWKPEETWSSGALTLVLALLLPWAGGWAAGLLGTRIKTGWEDWSADPAPWSEVVMRCLPTIFSAVGAYASLWVGVLVGHPLSLLGVIPASLAGGVASTLGSSIGRAFTSVAERLSSKLAGLVVGGVSAVIVGSLLGALLVTLGFTDPFDIGFSDLMLKGIIGGGLGGALASIPGGLQLARSEGIE